MGSAWKLSEDVVESRIGCLALDVDYLNANTFGDLSLRREILWLFGSQIDAAAKQLDLPMTEESWHFLTHTMKGAAAAVGAREIEALAIRWGKLAPPTTLPARQACARELALCFTAYKQEAAKLA